MSVIPTEHRPDPGAGPATGLPCLLLRPEFMGRQPYEPVWRAMSDFTDRRDAESADELWLLEHDPVFTLGQAGRREHLLAPGDIPVVACDRGGQVTYHGPGQIVAYPLFDLRRLGIGVREYVRRVEQVMIDALARFGIHAERRPGAPGVYVGQAKIGALGVRVRRGCAFHGLALNVNLDLEPFSRINPCGYKDLAVTQVVDLGGPGELRPVENALIDAFADCFGLAVDRPRTLQPPTPPDTPTP